MIEFKGEISKKTKKLIRRMDLLMLLLIPDVFISFIGMPLALSLYFGIDYLINNLWVALVCLVVSNLLFGIGYFLIPITDIIPLCIQIAPDGTVTTQNNKKQYTHEMDDILYVEDLGEHYSIVVRGYLIEKGRTLCQKDLLTQGTLEEFEKIYKDKIRRKS